MEAEAYNLYDISCFSIIDEQQNFLYFCLASYEVILLKIIVFYIIGFDNVKCKMVLALYKVKSKAQYEGLVNELIET